MRVVDFKPIGHWTIVVLCIMEINTITSCTIGDLCNKSWHLWKSISDVFEIFIACPNTDILPLILLHFSCFKIRARCYL